MYKKVHQNVTDSGFKTAFLFLFHGVLYDMHTH